jgi:uncharacterized iron-regulated membrane protein
MLLLCITGLPRIFHEQIDDLLHSQVKPADVPPGTPPANLDRLLGNALAQVPGKVPHFLIWDRDDPSAMFVSVGPTIDADPTNNLLIRMDTHTGGAAYLDAPDVTGRFTYIMLKLHTDMFAGLPGKLFLGLMGVLFCVAIISGIVVYAPSMRKLRFGAYRARRTRVVRWLDVHNLAGILLVAWTVVVGFTGVINTWADLVLKMWQFGQLAEMTAQYKDRPVPSKLTSLNAAVEVATHAVPGMTPSFVAFPGTLFSSKSHYAVFLHGDTPLTSRLLKPALIDAETGKLTDTRDMPLVCDDPVRLAAAAFRRLWRHAAQDRLGAARHPDHLHPRDRRVSVDAPPQGRCEPGTRDRQRRLHRQSRIIVVTSAWSRIVH